MTWSTVIRRTHRWTSMVFTATVAANFVAMGLAGGAQPPNAIVYAPLPPLFLLLGTGLVLFVQPYVASRRSTARTDRAGG